MELTTVDWLRRRLGRGKRHGEYVITKRGIKKRRGVRERGELLLRS
jgi:hypothetical protein